MNRFVSVSIDVNDKCCLLIDMKEAEYNEEELIKAK